MKFISVFLLPFLVMTCGIIEFLFPINYPQRYIEREVNKSDLVGTWEITPDSESRIKTYLRQQDGSWPISPTPWKFISLNNDRSCKVGLEISWSLNNEVLRETDSLSTCTWKIDNISGYDKEGSINHVPGLVVSFEYFNKQENKYYLYDSKSYIVEENNRLVLWSFIGDPSHLLYQDFTRIDQ